MAQAVVGALLGKLGAALAKEAIMYGASLIFKEASALKGLFREIRRAKVELEIMSAYLRDSEKLKDTQEIVGIFVKNIRDLAFRIEDVVDEFVYKLEDAKHGGLAAKIKKRIRHVKVWRRLALELHKINADLKDAAGQRDRYAMPGMDGWVGIGGSDHHATYADQTISFAREEDLVGIEDNVEKLTQWIVGSLDQRGCKIVTVWGMGGVGKTTLVDHVYKLVKADFHAAVWITVSRSYRAEDLLKKIATELGILPDASNIEAIILVRVIRNYLQGKRYILVLDDVWEKDLWISIMDVFPTNCIGRFILTSRKYEVKSLAPDNCSIQLGPLGVHHSRELFCNVAFRNEHDKSCPQELRGLATKFLQKCEGLPLAIACIGRLLSFKPPTYSAWKDVYDELELEFNKKVIPGVEIILKVSLEDLPYELKNCFLHCALFPEDCKLKRRRLARHWITAGFIKEKENRMLEKVAEGYLNQLVNRSLLQVVERNELGRVKSCRMHDIVRHLALGKAEKECFGQVCEGSRTFSVDGARRLSVHNADIEPLCQSGATHIRAIHSFTSHFDLNLLKPILASSKLLSILDLQGTQIKMLPGEVFSLFNLRLLGLRDTGIENLPEAVGRLQNLEVLDAMGTGLLSLPDDVAKLKKLRYLYVCAVQIQTCDGLYGGTKLPRGIKNLTGLHALQSIKASLETLSDVAALTELRTFAVCDVRSEHSSKLCVGIMNMNHLVHLTVCAANENEVLPLEELRLPETLSKLELDGQLEKQRMPQILSSWSHLKNLTRLLLRFSKLDEDSFSCLVVLRSLYVLELTKAYDGKILCFHTQSFPTLRQLGIGGALQLSKIEIEEGALKSLDLLVLLDCPELKCLPHGIEYLASLQELQLTDTSEELIEKLRPESEAKQSFQQEIRKICHIRRVLVESTGKTAQEGSSSPKAWMLHFPEGLTPGPLRAIGVNSELWNSLHGMSETENRSPSFTERATTSANTTTERATTSANTSIN